MLHLSGTGLDTFTIVTVLLPNQSMDAISLLSITAALIDNTLKSTVSIVHVMTCYSICMQLVQ